jgi:hypothetical protein
MIALDMPEPFLMEADEYKGMASYIEYAWRNVWSGTKL